MGVNVHALDAYMKETDLSGFPHVASLSCVF